MMQSVPVRYPKGLTLYPTQKLMIVRIIKAIQNSENVLGESPTGSGKTMALLSSTCAWLKQYMDQKKESREKCAIHGDGAFGGNMKYEETEDTIKEEMNETRDVKPMVPVKNENLCKLGLKRFMSGRLKTRSFEHFFQSKMNGKTIS